MAPAAPYPRQPRHTLGSSGDALRGTRYSLTRRTTIDMNALWKNYSKFTECTGN